MKVKTFVTNPLQENTYLLIDEESKKCVVVDAGFLFDYEEEEFSKYLEDNALELVGILNTHLHLDHCFGNDFLYKKYGLKAKADKKDESNLNMLKSYAQVFGIPYNGDVQGLDSYLNDGDEIIFGKTSLKVISVPGHSAGGIGFYNEKDSVLIIGDSLFKGSIGRTDLPGGDYGTLISSLTKRIMTLPEDTIVYPGHGPSTTIAHEKQYNPYL
jgi:glyoxylase-like metal-dependent hydrolase (beta-lactamase superfamily II)